jgi:hypothetical protein
MEKVVVVVVVERGRERERAILYLVRCLLERLRQEGQKEGHI